MQMSSRGKNDKYDSKTYNGSSERRPQELKSEPCKKKSPLRIQNDWSEHISSKGLIYYYNCRTEVSQWQKPADWSLQPMTQDEIKRLLHSKPHNGDSSTTKRNFPNSLSQDVNTSPKKIKYNNQQNSVEKRLSYNNNNSIYPKIVKSEVIKYPKIVTPLPNVVPSSNMKPKHTEANFNNDDMDISPSSSPLSRGSHSDEGDLKKQNYFDFETPASKNQISTKNVRNYNKSCSSDAFDKLQVSPGFAECSSGAMITKSVTYRGPQVTAFKNTHEHGSSTVNGSAVTGCTAMATTTLTQQQISLATVLRSTLSLLQLRTPDIKSDNNICLSVAHISELLTKFEAVLNNGGTVHSYRSHRLQTQLLQNSSSYSHCNDAKAVGKQSANVNQIKELVKYLQDFIQENYPNSMSSVTPVSPNYSKSARTQHYLQILHHLIETCLLQLSPQSLNSPSSTSSPGSMKDNNSTISVSTSVTSHSLAEHKGEMESPTKKDRTEPDRPKSVLCDPDMLKFVSSEISNSYRNQLADCYVQEAQVEYYKFVRLHSVLYPELACESKKLKALVRISEINTELFRQKKDDLEKLVHMLESRRLPNHLKCDYIPNS